MFWPGAIVTMAYSPIDQGALAASPLLRPIADRLGATPAQVALAWVAQKAVVTAPIVGASKPQHLDDAVAALALNLTPTEIAQLEAPYIPRVVAGHS